MKILGQIVAALLACNANVQIQSVAGFAIASTWWHVPITVLWLVTCSNAFNLIDGLDGLAVGVGLFATATAFLSALIGGNYALALATAPLLGALLGFFPYNFEPASIFMGDCGSLTVGFLLGCFGVIWSQKSATLLGMTAPLLALAVVTSIIAFYPAASLRAALLTSSMLPPGSSRSYRFCSAAPPNGLAASRWSHFAQSSGLPYNTLDMKNSTLLVVSFSAVCSDTL
jgi:UDP-N-acetylmuramyl pentapeptide phosphotransferase/UDP-N-acetylglucosamine-1-phosphate transferase